MGQDAGEVGARGIAPEEENKSAEQLRAEIEETRVDLGDTVEALAAKTDVKTRAREKADELKRTAGDKKDELIAKVKRSDNGSDGAERPGPAGQADTGGGAGEAVQRLKDVSRENPVQTAAAGAFVGGLLVGMRLARRG